MRAPPLPENVRWIWVSLPYATFLLAVRDGRVVAAAPIARKAIGKPEREVAAYYRAQGAVFREVAAITC
jgi:hypothetical protein